MAKPQITQEQLQQLLDDERANQEQLTHLDNLEKCGADCQALKAAIADVMQKSANIREYFAPPSYHF